MSTTKSIAQEVENLDSLDILNDEVENFLFQTQKGQVQLGFGYGLGVAYQNQDLAFTNSSVLIDVFGSFYAGYYICNTFWVGGFLYGGLRTVSFDYSNKNVELFLGGGPRIRKYFFHGLFTELSYARSKNQLTYTVEENIAKFDGYGDIYGIGIGIGNFWTKKISLEISLNYFYIKSHYAIYEEPNTSSNFNITANISFATRYSKAKK
ncbi:hypothetical protein [Flammeovirga agarivorans]|uniref:Outer membrane protein beta-barrel domain-containing protein n=1 Tax=Flammeovirga agarivorans TaxID=2726742 RepID=A0A7X8SLR0_9BACT|nr:hypothetical protein [Flammeovirga agarivorans]NLR92452.1 hypothetical protein [Flammeovirga agarivorans]